MKIISLFALLILTEVTVISQNLIGYNDKDIRRYMKENYSEMNYNNVTNSKFNYLKYTDGSDSQTLLFFLNPDSVCKSVRIICDIGIKGEKIKEFDTIFIKNGENRWIDRRKGKDYLIEIRDEKWSCIITIEPEK